MASDTTNMGLRKWDTLTDNFLFDELSDNWDIVDIHDHTGGGKGLAIPTAGIANLAVTTGKLADGAVIAGKIASGAVATANLDSTLTNLAIPYGGTVTFASSQATSSGSAVSLGGPSVSLNGDHGSLFEFIIRSDVTKGAGDSLLYLTVDSTIHLVVTATANGKWYSIGNSTAGSGPNNALTYPSVIDIGTGNHTVRVQYASTSGSASFANTTLFIRKFFPI